jgi:hypothetical protein
MKNQQTLLELMPLYRMAQTFSKCYIYELSKEIIDYDRLLTQIIIDKKENTKELVRNNTTHKPRYLVIDDLLKWDLEWCYIAFEKWVEHCAKNPYALQAHHKDILWISECYKTELEEFKNSEKYSYYLETYPKYLEELKALIDEREEILEEIYKTE